jgi:hypothetical protein
MKTITIPLDVSILLDGPIGISLYVAEEELPEHTIPLYTLVNEYIEAFSIKDRIAPEYEQDAYELIKQLRDCINILTQTLPE